MQALVVVYETKRKSLNVTPSATIQSVIDEAVLFFGITRSSPASLVLQYKAKGNKTMVTVNSADSFRLSGLASGAVVELVDLSQA